LLQCQTFGSSVSNIGEVKTKDAVGHLVFHITVGPSGQTVIEFERARFTCR
jgi:hypothetical protein